MKELIEKGIQFYSKVAEEQNITFEIRRSFGLGWRLVAERKGDFQSTLVLDRLLDSLGKHVKWHCRECDEHDECFDACSGGEICLLGFTLTKHEWTTTMQDLQDMVNVGIINMIRKFREFRGNVKTV